MCSWIKIVKFHNLIVRNSKNPSQSENPPIQLKMTQLIQVLEKTVSTGKNFIFYGTPWVTFENRHFSFFYHFFIVKKLKWSHFRHLKRHLKFTFVEATQFQLNFTILWNVAWRYNRNTVATRSIDWWCYAKIISWREYRFRTNEWKSTNVVFVIFLAKQRSCFLIWFQTKMNCCLPDSI